MASRLNLTPLSAEFPSANAPGLSQDGQSRITLDFDATTAETCCWSATAWQGFTGTMTALITYRAASAITGGVAFDVAVEAITDGDALDTDAASSFDAVNTGTASAVPGTAGHIDQISITLTNQDSIAAADLVRFSLSRNVAHASDTATGDIQVLAVEIRDAA